MSRIKVVAAWIAVSLLGGCGLWGGGGSGQAFYDADSRVAAVDATEWKITQGGTALRDPYYAASVTWTGASFTAEDLQHLLIAYDQAVGEDYRYEMLLGVEQEDGAGNRPEGVNAGASFDLKERGDALGLPGAVYRGDWNGTLSFDRATLSAWVAGWS